MHFSIRYKFGLLAAMLLLASCITDADREFEAIEYDCDDVVVIGRAEVLNYTSKTTSDDILGHGDFELNITIKQVRHGDESREIVQAYYHSHNQVRDDRDILFVLSPAGQGYQIERIALWDAQAKRALAKSCS